MPTRASWGGRSCWSRGLAVLAGPASAVTIDWVTVGNPGNAADTASNCYAADCGSVAEVYRISKFEMTNAQYAEFLNEKAASDPLGLYNPEMDKQSAGRGHAQRRLRELCVQREAWLREQAGELRVVLRQPVLHELAEQRSGEPGHGERGVHAARRHGDAEQRAYGHGELRREHLPAERERVVQGGVLGSRDAQFPRLPGGLERSDGVRGAGCDAEHGELLRRRRQRGGRRRVHRFVEARTGRSTRPGTCGSGTSRS